VDQNRCLIPAAFRIPFAVNLDLHR
jgi:hypothetical protein